MKVPLTNSTGQKIWHDSNKICKKLWNYYFNVYLCHTYCNRWQRVLNHCDIDGISCCRILLLTNTRTCTNTTTFSVENRPLGNEKSGRGLALSDADTLPQSNQASFSWIFALFFDTSFQSAPLNFSHWKNTEKNGTFSLFETSVKETVTFAYIMTFHFHSVLVSDYQLYAPFSVFFHLNVFFTTVCNLLLSLSLYHNQNPGVRCPSGWHPYRQSCYLVNGQAAMS